MKNSATATFFDITKWLDETTVIYPGDPPFDKTTILSCYQGDSFSLHQISMGNHTGTHIDFSAHFIPGGKTSSDYTLADFIGNAVVVEIPDDVKIISAQHIPNDLFPLPSLSTISPCL